jgi:hypothetical protein
MIQQRKYIRHPVEIPIEYKITGDPHTRSDAATNVSLGGLCFQSASAIPVGTLVSLSFPSINAGVEITGKVAWFAQKETHVDIGVEFQTRSEVYLAKTIEELCYIRKFEKNHPMKNN